MEHIVRKLVGEFVASEDAAREVCEAYWTAEMEILYKLRIRCWISHR